MPLIISQDTIFVNIHLEDLDDDETSRRIQLKWDTDLTTTLANGAAHAGLWNACSKSAVKRVTFSIEYTDLGDSAAVGAENQEVAHVALVLAQNPPLGLTKTGLLEIPSPIDAMRQGLTGPLANEIDASETNLVALFNDFQAAGNVYTNHGQNATKIKQAYIHHKGSKKG